MRHNLLRGVAAAAVLAGTSAYAADLPVYVEPVEPAPIVDVAAYSFSGAWIGVQAGGVFGGELDDLFDDDDDTDGIDFDELFDEDDGDFDDNSWEAGVAAGFDWQMGNFVFGVLGDVNWVDDLGRGGGYAGTYGIEVDPALSDMDTDLIEAAYPDGIAGPLDVEGAEAFFNDFDIPYNIVPAGGGDTYDELLDIDELGIVDFPLVFAPGTITDDVTFSEELNWYATARARAGVAFGRFMLYGTGGLSYGNVETSWSGTRAYDAEAATIAFASNSPTVDFPAVPGPGDAAEVTGLFELTEEDLPEGSCTPVDDGGELAAVCSTSGSEDEDRFGYALGVGTEFLVTQNFSLGLEYLYVNLGSGDDVEMDSELAGVDLDDIESEDFDFHTVKVRGAFRF